MLKHPNKAYTKYDYGIAAYPLSWKEYVISPQKICVQFNDVQCKARAPHSTDLKRTPWGTKELPIDTGATDISTLAVGIPLKLYPEVIKNILQAIVKHDELYPHYSIKSEIKEIINGFESTNL